MGTLHQRQTVTGEDHIHEQILPGRVGFVPPILLKGLKVLLEAANHPPARFVLWASFLGRRRLVPLSRSGFT